MPFLRAYRALHAVAPSLRIHCKAEVGQILTNPKLHLIAAWFVSRWTTCPAA